MKPERDAEMCVNPNCPEEATTATPEGAMCRECAALLASDLDQ